MLSSLYEASPTPSEEGGGGASPVRATLATRFYTQAAAVQAAAAAAAATAAATDAGPAGATQRTRGGSMPPAPQQQHGSSIYSSSPGSSSSAGGGGGGNLLLLRHAAAAPGKRAAQGLAHQHHHQGLGASPHASGGSHTSLVNLRRREGAEVGLEEYVPHGGVAAKDTFWPCCFNLSKVIMGAGMMAVPRAFMLLGVLPGGVLMLAIAGLTFFTLAALISASEAVAAGASYGALVRATLGRRAEAALQLAVLVNCYVMNVVFVVVLGDILIGAAPEYGGLLPEWTGASPDHCVWLRRDVVLGAASLAVLLPLAAMRSMERLAVVNIIGVACNGVFAGLTLALAAGAAANGVLQPLPLMPNWAELGTSPLLAAVSIAAVVPVLLNCDVCHQSLHPLMPLLHPYSVPRMQRLVALALAICNALYMTVTICSGLVFGQGLHSDVLTNITSAAMAPLIGPPAALAMAAAVRVGYLLSIVGSYVLLCYPLRQCVGDLLLPGGQATMQHHWLLLTTLLVASCAAIGAWLPSIWGALSLVGATASTTQAFIIPSLLVLALERAPPKAGAAAAAGAHAWEQQRQRQHGDGGDVREPLLPGADGDAERGGVQHAAAGPAELAAAAAAASAGVGGRTHHAGRRALRQAVALLCLLVGVGLFSNSVIMALWDAAHPRAEGAAGLMAVYRRLLVL